MTERNVFQVPNRDVRVTATNWAEKERFFSENMYYGTREQDEVNLALRQNPILLVAPHSLNHYRFGREKYADRGTGSLVQLLGGALDMSYIVPTGPISSWTTWSDRSDPFSDSLRAAVSSGIVKLVVDFHGMSDKYGTDICIGTGNVADKPEADLFLSRYRENAEPQFSITVNQPFDGSPDFTVTSFTQSLGVAAVQVEISARFRRPSTEPAESQLLIDSFMMALSETAELLRRR